MKSRWLAGLGGSKFAAAAVMALMLLYPAAGSAADRGKIRLGLLAFGTVNWEIDVVKHHGLDRKNGVDVQVRKLAGKNATAVALQAGSVDAIVTDWIWVSRQRHKGADYTFVPHSLAVGGVMVRPDSGIASIADLKGKRIGVAGGPVDKSWLLLRAYAKKTIGADLKDVATPVFAAPPLLNKIMLRKKLPAVLNFWHYNARLSAAGMHQLISVADILPALGVKRTPPLLGWVFSERWAAAHMATVRGFLTSLREAKKIMAESDAEWQRLKPLTKAKDETTLRALRDGYRAGMPQSFGERDVEAAKQIFETLAAYGGAALVGESKTLAPGTFWSKYRY
jgi:NitT/TauT family transport system substrate-binding protein